MRPALLVRRDRVELPQDELQRAMLTDAQRLAVEQLLPGVAAVGLAGEALGLGTGFLVAPTVLCTNRHVVQALTRSQDSAPVLAEGVAVAHFGLEYRGDLSKPRIPITRVLGYPQDPALDLAFLQLAGPGPLPTGLPLARSATLQAGQVVVVVGYPGDDARAPAWSKLLFDGRFGVKRASPGELLGSAGRRCFHDSSTLGGNSGSPIIDAQSGCVIAVHSSGQFAYRNEAMLTSALAADPALAAQVQSWRSLP
jgi:V8-like Glu-specific endopeptidase